jgi:hypothetical protein
MSMRFLGFGILPFEIGSVIQARVRWLLIMGFQQIVRS